MMLCGSCEYKLAFLILYRFLNIHFQIASYLKYGDAMEAEMECHFGKLLDEGAHFITFKQVSKLL